MRFGSIATRKLSLSGFHNLFTHDFVSIDSNFLFATVATRCTNLIRISLSQLILNSIRFEAILNAFPHLSELTIRNCKLDDTFCVISLTSRSGSSDLRSLELIRNEMEMNQRTIEAIFQLAPHLERITLNLIESTVADDSIQFICVNFVKLTHLGLINTMITDIGIDAICSSQIMRKNLVSLDLSRSNFIDNDCLIKIVHSLANLQSLYLRTCFGISNLDLFAKLEKLSCLDVNNTSIDARKSSRDKFF